MSRRRIRTRPVRDVPKIRSENLNPGTAYFQEPSINDLPDRHDFLKNANGDYYVNGSGDYWVRHEKLPEPGGFQVLLTDEDGFFYLDAKDGNYWSEAA